MTTARRSLRHSLAQELRARIRAGEWRPGERIPSEPELARQETVSRSSMRAAITLLEEEGFVSRRHGSGTYVTHRPTLPSDLGRNFGVSSLIALDRARARHRGGERRRSSPRPPRSPRRSASRRATPVSALRRVRTADGRRVVDVTDWCRVDHLAPDDLPEVGSIYAALAERGLAVDHGVAHLTPWNADGEVARAARRPERHAAADDRPGRPHGRRRRRARLARAPPRRRLHVHARCAAGPGAEGEH